MSRLRIMTPDKAQTVVEGLYKDIERRIVASPPGLCPVDMSLAFLQLSHAQTCGKCAPCRIGLGQLANMLESVLNQTAELEIIELIEKTARVIRNTCDCAIGYEAADMVLKGVSGFEDDYREHILNGRCISNISQAVPCVELCPAGVDIPGYIALVSEGRCDDAIRLIRKDNPMPVVCGYICEHPCEARCRRNMVDNSINIRGLKRYAADNAGKVEAPACQPSTGKKIAVVGGGPSGLTAAYYLSLMGHKAVIFESKDNLGGMLRYGIPGYRLPREELDAEIELILSSGIEVQTGVKIGETMTIQKLREQFDSVYIAIGAHMDKKLGIEGEDKNGVISAVEMLRNIGGKTPPDFSGKRVVVIGGGNVAMDVCRSAVRLGAEDVTVVYRRRRADMTALPEEIEGAAEEGCHIATLQAPIRIEADDAGNVAALWTQPQIVGLMDSSGRPKPMTAQATLQRFECDYIVVAVGQGIEADYFAEEGLPVKRGLFSANDSSEIESISGVFAGGDCVTGPTTVIRAIAAGKVAAANIDEYLGYHHAISVDVDVPAPRLFDKPAKGRVNMRNISAAERKCNFELYEVGMSKEEAEQESHRCLRCDHFGYGVFKGGRSRIW